MTGKELIDWLDDEQYGRKMAGSYLAGFIHGQVACESRATEFNLKLNIPNSLDVPLLIKYVRSSAGKSPELLNLDVATFMFAVFEDAFS